MGAGAAEVPEDSSSEFMAIKSAIEMSDDARDNGDVGDDAKVGGDWAVAGPGGLRAWLGCLVKGEICYRKP